jgi:hypothetical protein
VPGRQRELFDNTLLLVDVTRFPWLLPVLSLITVRTEAQSRIVARRLNLEAAFSRHQASTPYSFDFKYQTLQAVSFRTATKLLRS